MSDLGEKIRLSLFAAYWLIAIITFGHSASYLAECAIPQKRGEARAMTAFFLSPALAMAWPLYWSVLAFTPSQERCVKPEGGR